MMRREKYLLGKAIHLALIMCLVLFSSLKCLYLFFFLKTPDVVHPKEATPSSAFTAIRPARVVSSTSEEEEAFTEEFLKINCKYITSGKVRNSTLEKLVILFYLLPKYDSLHL